MTFSLSLLRWKLRRYLSSLPPPPARPFPRSPPARYLGETEAKLRSLFARARAAAPCILFLDELDSIIAKRGDGGMGDAGGGEAGGVYARVLSTLLNEMDGVASGGGTSQPKRQVVDDSPDGVARQGISSGTAESEGSDRSTVSAGGRVLVLAATSRRHMLDSALLRPGRLHESIEFGMPNKEDREGVLRVHARRLPLAAQVDFERLSRDDVSGGLSCADLEVSENWEGSLPPRPCGILMHLKTSGWKNVQLSADTFVFLLRSI